MRRTFLLLICLASLLAVSVAPGLAEKRVALVIGNSAYRSVQHLQNPVNDAADMAAVLSSIGFNVKQLDDLDRVTMEEAIADFSTMAVRADIGLVFYAGHGIEVDRRNYLIPVDAKLATDRRVTFETVSLDYLLAALDGVKGVRIVLLDSCRNNPFSTSMKVTSSSRSVGRGLSRVEAAKGTLISFSAKEGTIAADGQGRNSPYTAALLGIVKQPGLEIGLMFREVRDRVLAATNNEQEPFVSASLSSKTIYLVPPIGKAQPSPRPVPTPQLQLGPVAQAWAATKDTTSAEVLRVFIERFKGSVYADLAAARLHEIDKQATAATVPQPTEQVYYLAGLDPTGDNWLALRSDPSTTRGRILRKMGPDTLLKVLDRRGKWLRIRLLSGEQGWAYSGFIACCREVPKLAPLAGELTVSYAQALAFVENLNSHAAASDLPTYVAQNYANEVDYYDKGTLSNSAVLQDKERWFARWENWEINVVPNTLSLDDLGGGRYELSYEFRYQWTGRPRADGTRKILRGSATALRRVIRERGKIKIYSENTEVAR